jgi:hypothetical protein
MSKWYLRPGNAELQLGKTETHARLEPGAPRKGAPLAPPFGIDPFRPQGVRSREHCPAESDRYLWIAVLARMFHELP